MRRYLLSLLLATTALLSGNVLAEELPRVLLLGDSISLGYEQPTRDLLAGLASVHHPPENCQSTEYGLVKIEEWLGSTPWDVIHFNWGIWDAHHFSVDDSFRTTHAEYEQNLRTLVARLKLTGAQLIWASTTPLRGRIDVAGIWVEEAEIPIRNAIAYQVMVDNGIAINDLYTEMLPQLAQLQSADNVHFTPAGNNFLAQRVVDSIFSGEPVPDYVGMTQANAETAVVADGFTLGAITTAYSETVATGIVISQNPLPGTLLTAPVDLVVSLGNVRGTVPDVVGQDQASAESDVVAANLSVEATYSFSDTIPVGDVISQNPASGTDVLAGSSVEIEVSRGDLATVQYWLLDDGSGNSVANQIPGGNSGTLVGPPTWITTGLPPNLPSTAALDLDPGDHLDGGNIDLSSSSGGGEVTVSMWLNPDALDGDKRILGQLSGATSQAGAVGVGQTAGAGGLWVWDGAGFGHLTNAGALGTGSWQHLALVWDSGQVTAYLDGVAQLTATAGFDFGAGNGNFGVAAKFVGQYGDGFDGQIDDVAIFDVALSAQDVLALYQQSPEPVISTLSPADDATGVAVDSNLVVTFDREVVFGTGNITLMSPADFWEGGGDTVVETFDVTTSPRLQVSGTMVTIDPSSDLAASVGYYVLIDSTAIKDTSDNFFAGTSGSGSWNFTTIVSSNTFAEWIAGFGVGGLTGVNDDFDLDGLANGLEAWFGTHPGQFNAGLAGLTTDGTTTTFSHPQNANPPSDLSGFYQWSPDLQGWYAGDGTDGPAGGPTVTISPNTVGTTTTVTATASEAMDRLFLRAAILAPTSPPSATVTLTQVGATSEWDIDIDPITFTATNTTAVQWLIFEDYFSADATVSGLRVSGTLDVSVNGGATINIVPANANGTWGGVPFGPLDSNDLVVNIAFAAGVPSLSVGDSVTVSGSVRFSSTTVPAPVAGPVDAALWNSGGTILTDEVSVAVP